MWVERQVSQCGESFRNPFLPRFGGPFYMDELKNGIRGDYVEGLKHQRNRRRCPILSMKRDTDHSVSASHNALEWDLVRREQEEAGKRRVPRREPFRRRHAHSCNNLEYKTQRRGRAKYVLSGEQNRRGTGITRMAEAANGFGSRAKEHAVNGREEEASTIQSCSNTLLVFAPHPWKGLLLVFEWTSHWLLVFSPIQYVCVDVATEGKDRKMKKRQCWKPTFGRTLVFEYRVSCVLLKLQHSHLSKFSLQNWFIEEI